MSVFQVDVWNLYWKVIMFIFSLGFFGVQNLIGICDFVVVYLSLLHDAFRVLATFSPRNMPRFERETTLIWISMTTWCISASMFFKLLFGICVRT